MRADASIRGSLAELRPWFVVGGELGAGLAALCDGETLRAGLSSSEPAEARPDFLLVEGGVGVPGALGDELDAILARCERAGVARILWITAGRLDPYWLERCERFDRVFTVDSGQVDRLGAAGAVDPWRLWPAVALPPGASEPARSAEDGPATSEARGPTPSEATVPPAGERSESVVWLGGWSEEWPKPWRQRLASVLRGAVGRGLRIVPVADLDGLPADLHDCVAPAAAAGERGRVLREAKVAIAADPRYGSASLAPAAAFEAAANGAAPISPHDFLTLHDFAVGGSRDVPWRNLVPIVHDGEAAGREIDELLADELLLTEVTAHLRRIVANNHTYAHRLATLASAAGIRLVPDSNPAAA